jgi:hypothetical protein
VKDHHQVWVVAWVVAVAVVLAGVRILQSPQAWVVEIHPTVNYAQEAT